MKEAESSKEEKRREEKGRKDEWIILTDCMCIADQVKLLE